MLAKPFACALVLLAACGGAGDGDTGDAASGDDATGGGDSSGGGDVALELCERSGLLFCEDFEALPIGAASNTTSAAWDVEAANGQLAVDATHARGQRALRITTNGNGRGRLTVSGLAPAGNSLYGVMHVWVTAFPSAPDYAHYTLAEFAGTGSGTLLRPIGGQYVPAQGVANPAGSFWGVGSDGGPTGDWTNWRRTAPSVAGQWLCLEWRMNAADGAIDVWIDGIAKPELSVTRTMHGGTSVDLTFPAIDRAWFGWWLYQAAPTPAAFEVWLDDLALGDARLGCE